MELTFKFTKEEAQIILSVLVKRPLEEVIVVYEKLQSQAKEQLDKESKSEKI